MNELKDNLLDIVDRENQVLFESIASNAEYYKVCYEVVDYLWDYVDVKLILFVSYLASFMISYCRARAEVFFKGDFDIGLMARSERLFYLFITMLIAFFYGFAAEFLFIFMWLVLGTYFYRSIKILAQIKKAEN